MEYQYRKCGKMDINYKKIYIDWLYDNIDQYQIYKNVYRITFPYLDRNNDCIEIFIFMQEDGSYKLTDDGETISELELSGFNVFSSEKRKTIFNKILDSHGVSLSENNELLISCSREDLPLKKHMLSQCMIKISDLFYLSKPNIISLFNEEVREFLDTSSIRYMPDISFVGKSGLTTNYDFAIPKSSYAPERIIKVANNLDTSMAGNITFLWNDTKEARNNESSLYVFIQDTDKKVNQAAITLLDNYNITPALWSNRNKFTGILAK